MSNRKPNVGHHTNPHEQRKKATWGTLSSEGLGIRLAVKMCLTTNHKLRKRPTSGGRVNWKKNMCFWFFGRCGCRGSKPYPCTSVWCSFPKTLTGFDRSYIDIKQKQMFSRQSRCCVLKPHTFEAAQQTAPLFLTNVPNFKHFVSGKGPETRYTCSM